MNYGLYSIHDSLIGFSAPIMDIGDEQAIRGFRKSLVEGAEDLAKQGVQIYQLSLYKLGVFDTESGLVEPNIPPQFLVMGSDSWLAPRTLGLKEGDEKEGDENEE